MTSIPYKKILVIGARGWFGKNFLSLLGDQHEVLAIGSKEELLQIGHHQITMKTFSRSEISKFNPDLVLDSAFITRERIPQFTKSEYFSLNREIMQNALWTRKLSSVEKFIGISSGAAEIHRADNTREHFERDYYGSLKAEYEDLLEEESKELGAKTLILRPWSVSGCFNPKPKSFAFSSLVLGALRGKIKIESDKEVWRRYTAITDLLKVGVGAQVESFRIIDSGGQAIELGQLAYEIRRIVNPNAVIERSLTNLDEVDSYLSNNESWSEAVKETNFTPQDLGQQIKATLKDFRM